MLDATSSFCVGPKRKLNSWIVALFGVLSGVSLLLTSSVSEVFSEGSSPIAQNENRKADGMNENCRPGPRHCCLFLVLSIGLFLSACPPLLPSLSVSQCCHYLNSALKNQSSKISIFYDLRFLLLDDKDFPVMRCSPIPWKWIKIKGMMKWNLIGKLNNILELFKNISITYEYQMPT